MKVINLIWGYTLGAGIDKCYMTYATLPTLDKSLEVKNVCINVLSRNSHIEPLKNLNVTFIEIKSPADFSWIGKLKRCIEEYNADVLFTHGFNGAIIALIEKYLKSIKADVVLTYHGSYHAPTKKKKLIEPIYNALTHLIYKHLSKVTICVAEYSRQYLLSKGVPENKVVTVHNGIKDILPFVPSKVKMDRGVVNIVTISRIDKVKGLSYMMEAVALLKRRRLNFHYYMIGEGPELNDMKRLCKKYRLEDVVSFKGFQNNVSEWLACADVFALPSLYEYHSIAILEAMRAGKAIVATTVGGNVESIKDKEHGLLVPPHDAESLANGLECLIINNVLRESLASSARKRFEMEFTEDAMKRNLIKVLKS